VLIGHGSLPLHQSSTALSALIIGLAVPFGIIIDFLTQLHRNMVLPFIPNTQRQEPKIKAALSMIAPAASG
jgi:hypothetical protein